MKFKKSPIIKAHYIQTLRKEEQNNFLAANDEPDHERHLFEEDRPYLRF